MNSFSSHLARQYLIECKISQFLWFLPKLVHLKMSYLVTNSHPAQWRLAIVIVIDRGERLSSLSGFDIVMSWLDAFSVSVCSGAKSGLLLWVMKHVFKIMTEFHFERNFALRWNPQKPLVIQWKHNLKSQFIEALDSMVLWWPTFGHPAGFTKTKWKN